MTVATRVGDMPKLNPDDVADAGFRARDRAWAALADLFEHLREEENLTYEELGKRIGKKKSQVHRWLSSPSNVTLQSFGLLAEGMDSDLNIELIRRLGSRANTFHQCESAALRNKFESFVLEYQQRKTPRDCIRQNPSSYDIMVDAVE